MHEETAQRLRDDEAVRKDQADGLRVTEGQDAATTVSMPIAQAMVDEMMAAQEMRDEHAKHEKDVALATRYNALTTDASPIGQRLTPVPICGECKAAEEIVELDRYNLRCPKCNTEHTVTMDGKPVSQDVLDMAKWLAESEKCEEIPFDEVPTDVPHRFTIPLSVLFSLYDRQTEALLVLAQRGLDGLEEDVCGDGQDRFRDQETVGFVLEAAAAAHVPGVYLGIIALLMTDVVGLIELLGKEGAVNEHVVDTCVDLSNKALILGALHETR